MRIIFFIVHIFLVNLSSFAQVFSDEALNYNNTWTNGSNRGSGFEPWQLTTVGSTGLFIGNPANDGMQTMVPRGLKSEAIIHQYLMSIMEIMTISTAQADWYQLLTAPSL